VIWAIWRASSRFLCLCLFFLQAAVRYFGVPAAVYKKDYGQPLRVGVPATAAQTRVAMPDWALLELVHMHERGKEPHYVAAFGAKMSREKRLAMQTVAKNAFVDFLNWKQPRGRDDATGLSLELQQVLGVARETRASKRRTGSVGV
jgi:hypothetical protein